MANHKFNQIAPLRDRALNALVGFLSTKCYKCTLIDDLSKLRQIVAYIKEDLDPRIPWYLAGEIYNGFLEKYPWPCEKEILDILMPVIMDRKIVGLECSCTYLRSFHPIELGRIRGLVKLELKMEIGIGDMTGLPLGDLQEFIHQYEATDHDLWVMGQNCPLLKYLDVSHSKKVTDVGLRALSPCTNLSSVDASGCPVSLSGINDLLSANKKIGNLSAWDYSGASDSSVYPSIGHFGIVLRQSEYRLRNHHLPLVVVKFPNLRSIAISGYTAEDLSVLRSLSQLSEIELNCDYDYNWDNVQLGLRQFGAMIKKMSLFLRSSVQFNELQRQLNFIFEFCGNIEYLNIEHQVHGYRNETLLIPAFRKLKKLVFHSKYNPYPSGILEFSGLLEVEEIEVQNISLSSETTESLIRDKTKYPNLRTLSIPGSPNDTFRIKYCENIRKDNNPNLTISYLSSRPLCSRCHCKPARISLVSSLLVCTYCRIRMDRMHPWLDRSHFVFVEEA